MCRILTGNDTHISSFFFFFFKGGPASLTAHIPVEGAAEMCLGFSRVVLCNKQFRYVTKMVSAGGRQTLFCFLPVTEFCIAECLCVKCNIHTH